MDGQRWWWVRNRWTEMVVGEEWMDRYTGGMISSIAVREGSREVGEGAWKRECTVEPHLYEY